MGSGILDILDSADNIFGGTKNRHLLELLKIHDFYLQKHPSMKLGHFEILLRSNKFPCCLTHSMMNFSAS